MRVLSAELWDEDRLAAIDWFEKAVAAGDSDALYEYARRLRATDPDRALVVWKKAAAAGDARSMFEVGSALRRTDRAEARRYLERGAELGHIPSMYQLWGMLLRSGDKNSKIWHERLHDRHDEALAYMRSRQPRSFGRKLMNSLQAFAFEKDKPKTQSQTQRSDVLDES